MLQTLFRVNEKDSIIIDAEAVKLVPELKKVSQKDLLFIILAYDYHSPHKQLDPAERLRRAMRRAYGKDEEAITTRLQKGIDAYCSLQYDERRETIITYQTKIGLLRLEIINEILPNKIKIVSETITHLQKEISRLQEEVNREEETIMLTGGGKLSLIERYQQNKLAFAKNKEQQSQFKKDVESRSKPSKVSTEKLA